MMSEAKIFLRTEFDLIERIYAITGVDSEFYAEDVFVGGDWAEKGSGVYKVMENEWRDWSCCQKISDKDGNPCKCKRSPLGYIIQPRIITPTEMRHTLYGLKEMEQQE